MRLLIYQIALFDVFKLAHGLINNAHNMQFLLLKLAKPGLNRGFFLFTESNLRVVSGCFHDNCLCFSKNSLIDSFEICFSF